MIVLGLCGGHYGPTDSVTRWSGHDAAAVLVSDGEVVAAVEEERLTRVKHANWFPIRAVGACLKQADISLSDIDRFAFPWQARTIDTTAGPRPLMSALEDLVEDRLEVSAHGRVRLCQHHEAHAYSAVLPSDLGDCLVAVFDGSGDGQSGAVYEMREGTLGRRASFSVDQSLGEFYTAAIAHIGLRRFEEYKAMGLAPYGEVSGRVVDLSDCLMRMSEGNYRLDREALRMLTKNRPAPRLRGDPFSDWDQAFAAGLQRLLVATVQHVLHHHQSETNLRQLAVAGGVMHNCSLNGILARSGNWDRIFVQPAAHDAGAALGAALAVCRSEHSLSRLHPMRTVAWGTHIGSDETVRQGLERWSRWVTARRIADPAATAAEALADDKIIGWVQGRAEFGPRALGYRSILADPRPAANRDRVNQRIKRREAFRPFAPAVPSDCADTWFAPLEAIANTNYMSFVSIVRPEFRDRLGAVTHVDGTARVQTVDRIVDPLFASLLDEFGKRTGVSVVLNTSFNGPAEPIIDSLDDAVAGLLTLDLDCLVVGNYLVTPIASLNDPESLRGLCPSLPFHRRVDGDTLATTTGSFFDQHREPVSAPVAALLAAAHGRVAVDESHDEIVAELAALWRRKIIRLQPLV